MTVRRPFMHKEEMLLKCGRQVYQLLSLTCSKLYCRHGDPRSNPNSSMYPATHIVLTCHDEERCSRPLCTRVWVLVTTCYIQTIESSTRGHGCLGPINSPEYLFWPLTSRRIQCSDHTSAPGPPRAFSTSYSRFTQRRCVGVNISYDFISAVS